MGFEPCQNNKKSKAKTKTETMFVFRLHFQYNIIWVKIKKAKIPRIMERKFNSIMPFHFSAKPLHLISVFYEIIDIFHCNSHSLFKKENERRRKQFISSLWWYIHSFIQQTKWRKTKGVGLRFPFRISFHYNCIVVDVFCSLRLHEFNMTNIKHRLAFAIQWLHKLTTQAIKFYRYDFLVKMVVASVFNEFSQHGDSRLWNFECLQALLRIIVLAQFTKRILLLLCLVQSAKNIEYFQSK